MSANDRDIMTAVASLAPGAAWNFTNGKGLAGLSWTDPHIPRPSDAAIAAEIQRLAALSSAPAGARLEQHLNAAIAELAPQKEKPMRGMQRLAHFTETMMKEIDDRADKVVDRLAKASDRATAAIGKFEEHAGDVEAKADEIEKALALITNSPPSEASGISQ